MEKLTHVDREGKAHMVDVSRKTSTLREAVARATLTVSASLLRLIQEKALPKGDVLTVSRIAGIQAAKKTAELIPMCHPLPLSHIHVAIEITGNTIHITSTVKTLAQTGVEMEALTAVSISALTFYDMCKSYDKGLVISDVQLLKKSGGKSGIWKREQA